MRVVIVLVLSLLLPVTALLAADRPVITINLRGDRVEFDQELGTVAVQGTVTATAQSDRPGAPTVSMAAAGLEGNLRTGLLIAHDGVQLRSQQLALRGELLKMNFQTDEFTLQNGGLSVEVENPRFPGRLVRGFFFGNEIARQADLIYVIEGRVTTCDRQDPHYSIGVRKLSFDTRTGILTIRDGRLQLYGLKLKLPGSYQTSLRSQNGRGESLPLPLPGYSSYDGLYFPFAYDLLPPEDDWRLTASARVGTKLQLPGSLVLERAAPDESFTAMVTRREDVTWDLNRRSRISRLPELQYWRGWDPTLSGNSRLQGTLFAGRVHERAPDLPQNSASRAGVLLSYSGTPLQRQDRRGMWWATELDQTFYDTGDRLRDLRLEAGLGRHFNDRTRGAIWAVHHFTSGSSPFLFDDIYVEDEILGSFSTWFTEKWGLGLYGRYDVDESDLRDYRIKLSRRHHCLTWSLQYSRAGHSIGIGLDLNGLTGDAPPAQTKPLVAPEAVPPLPEMIPAPEGASRLFGD